MVWGGHEPKTESETPALCTLEFNDHAEIVQQTNGTTHGDSWDDQHHQMTGNDGVDQSDHPHRKWPPPNDTELTPYQGPPAPPLENTAPRCSQLHEFPATNVHSIVPTTRHCTTSTMIKVQ